ncbi:MAG: 1,4-dihydroxy-2-naphthoate octaprenyltransferase [Chlamydiota bacterium]|nr:1,4-dihydroxy-2-naphthoate octaprenyltransferase [Chlamydiota bacterium]
MQGIFYKHSLKPWLLAARPKTLTASIAPVIVSSFLAMNHTGTFSLFLSFLALLSSLCIQIGTNLANDAIDFKKGADGESRLGPIRVTQKGLLSPRQVMIGAMLFFLASIIIALPLVLKGGWIVAVLLAVSVVSGYLYTGGPYPLAYYGLGDLFVILFFGVVSTFTFYYVQTQQFSFLAGVGGLQVGLLCNVMLVINNLRDREEDAKVNKKTLAVRFGEYFSKLEVTALVYFPFILTLVWYYYGYTYAAVLPWVSFLLGSKIVRSIWATRPSEVYNVFLGFSALLHLTFSILLCIGLLL